ncbi:MAG: hypothetical protein KAS32_04660 [Candidatus Peribacteraceae bacterium]|nr:hypothetical protein [Candidatus Peribacteraceae bacterium]
MKTSVKVLKKWIEDAELLRNYTNVFPKEVQEIVNRLSGVIEILAYENIIMDEEKLEWEERCVEESYKAYFEGWRNGMAI